MLAVVSGFGGSYMQLVIMLFELFAQVQGSDALWGCYPWDSTTL